MALIGPYWTFGAGKTAHLWSTDSPSFPAVLRRGDLRKIGESDLKKRIKSGGEKKVLGFRQ